MSSDIVTLLAIDVEALKQRLNALVASTSSPSVLMPSDIVALPTDDVEVLKQRLDALVTAVEATKEKAATARHRVLAARQLLDKEQAAATDLEWQAAAKKLVPGSTSSSTTKTVITSPSYVDTIIVNFHIQADTMMEKIHLDTSGLAAALTAFYINKTPSAPLPPPRPPGKNNGNGADNGNDSNNNNQNRNNNRRNDSSDGKNSNTIVASHSATTNDGRGPPPWSTYVNPSSGHIVMYPGPAPTGQQRLQAFMATTGPYTPPGFVPGQQQLYQQTPPVPTLGWAPWNGVGWDQQSLANSFSTMVLQSPHNSINDWVADSGASHHTTPSIGNISNPHPLKSASPSSIIIGNGSTLPVTSVGDSVIP
jgi:hypothetical protein